MNDPQPAQTPEFSDYLAAIKRRRFLLLGIALPILAIGLSLALGLPDIFVATGLITFKDATVSGDVPNDPSRVRREKAYMDEYVNSLSNAVLSPPTIAKLLD